MDWLAGKANKPKHCLSSALCLVVVTAIAARASEPGAPLEKRPAWTSSRIQGSPEPPPPYTTERAFPKLQFQYCVDLVSAPGVDRLFLVEQYGKIFSFPNRDDVEKADLVVDLRKEIPGVQQVYALAFHPQFEQNRYCYICYIKQPEDPNGTHVARFRMLPTDPPTLDVASETTLVTWLSGGHNGCCLKFGPDGCLYISTGDAGPANPPDPLRAGQDLSNLLSAILRIDVDHADEGRNYRIPPDNPFVDLEGARGEIWAYGLRNPWRMSFDRKTGDLWVGDVGWELWEMLYRVQPGGNYGWAVMEGSHPVNPEWPRGPTPFLEPTIELPHSESSSITDGLTYYGSRLKELYGMHIYSDYDTGKFWGFRFENGQVLDHRELADTTHRVVGFGEDHAGEFFILDHTAGTIQRLIPNPVPDLSKSFPRKLSETGLFSHTADQIPAPGVLAFSINAEMWADHAGAQRFVALPGDAAIEPADKWTFPKNTVLVKTLSLDLEANKPETRRKIETQILHYDGVDWMPYTYRWNAEQTDADLAPAGGEELTIDVVDPQAAGGVRRQVWRFAGRAECQRCHNPWSGPPLAFNLAQLNRTIDLSGSTFSQLDAFTRMGLFESAPSTDKALSLADPTNASADLNDRARAYLHANCGHCHRKHAGGAVLSHMHFDLPLNETNMIGARPSQGTFGIYDAKVIAAGDPYRSVLWYRMNKLGSGRMPHIGSTHVDAHGVNLIHDWIRSLPAESDSGLAGEAAKIRDKAMSAASELPNAAAADRRSALIEQLLSNCGDALVLLRAIDQAQIPEALVVQVARQAQQQADPGVRDLFERFVPPDERIKRLGSVVRPQEILALAGDSRRGNDVFFNTNGVSCKNCHRIGTQGKELGPDLTEIGKKYTKAELLESILEPSKRIDAKYLCYLVETAQGEVFTGLLVQQDDREVVLRDATDKLIRIPADEVEQLAPQKESLMPELLLRELTAQQVADLLEYLSEQK